ncbi:hypothetical protein SAMN02745116_02534 [Pilibacter termitis]|uniref:Winged helix DNA-binding domain-containing protein n=1 Tax=Pilibacter termitis TaxID=263852 RepID=A0A1T4RC03_9ENTE|nr:hypothetical protein [Pilibacter termitis]SKA13580.1 hypothetical protein SAMN02745116_02534 [Pilibacter termitis]
MRATKLKVLEAISENENIKNHELEHITTHGASYISTLVSGGYVERFGYDDKRKLTLTEKGVLALEDGLEKISNKSGKSPNWKKEVYNEALEYLVEDMRQATNYNDRKDIINTILKVMKEM